MKKLFISLALIICLSAVASAQKTKSETREVAKGTTLTENKASVKVVTTNEAVWHELITKYRTNFKKYTVTFKKDRSGEYNEYSIPFTLEQLPEVEEFLTSLK